MIATTRTTVQSLLAGSCPSAIVGRIAALVVNPLDCQFLRTLTHIRKEVFELVPALAYRNAATTVVMIILLLRIVAALMHVDPCRIRRTRLSRRLVAMPKQGIASTFLVQTATRLRVIAAQIPTPDNQLRAAVAATPPQHLLVGRSSAVSKHDQPAEPLVRQVNPGAETRTTGFGKMIVGHMTSQEGYGPSDGWTRQGLAVALLV